MMRASCGPCMAFHALRFVHPAGHCCYSILQMTARLRDAHSVSNNFKWQIWGSELGKSDWKVRCLNHSAF